MDHARQLASDPYAQGAVLVQLLLSEGDVDAAWEAADRYGPGWAWREHSMMIQVAEPDSLTSPESDANYLDQILTGLIDTRNRETTALLAVIAELLVDDPEPPLRCRREVAERGEHLPRRIGALSRAEVYRAVRRTYVFGDVDRPCAGAGSRT